MTGSLEAWVSLSAVIIALCAFLVSAWQGYLFRLHNKLSVRPLLDFDIRQEMLQGDMMSVVTIKNDGLGPAIIDNFSVSHKNQQLTANSLYQLVKENLSNYRFSRFFDLPIGTIIRPGESMDLLGIPESAFSSSFDEEKTQQSYRNFLSIKIEVNYHSIYIEKQLFNKALMSAFPGVVKSLQTIEQD